MILWYSHIEVTEMYETVYQRIKRLRIANNLTQDDLAKRCGYTSRTAIHLIETGKRNLTADKIQIIANALNVKPSYLIDGDNKKTISPKKQMLINEIEKIDDEKTLNQIKDIITVILNS